MEIHKFLGLDDIRIQAHNISKIKEWLHVTELKAVNDVPNSENEIFLYMN